MGLSLALALRYMRSKKRAFVSVGTMFAIFGVALGAAALSTVVSVTGGFRAEFREKVLGVNAHVLVLKYSSDFREYRKVMEKVQSVPGVVGVAPFVINPMMLTHDDRTATGVLVKGVDPSRVSSVLDLPRHITEGSLQGLRLGDAKPPERRRRALSDDFSPLPPLPPASSGSGGPGRAPAPSPLPSGKVAPPAPNGSGAAAPAPAGTIDQKGLFAGIEESIRAGSGPDANSRATSYGDAGAPDAASEPEAEITAEPGDPVGNIEPEGGYASKLPEDDVIPEELDPDPCKNPELVKKLPGIVIGSTLQKNLAAQIGDCIQVTSPTIGFSYSRGAMHAPIAKQFRVIAVFDAGFDQYDSKLAYTDLYEAQAFYDSGDSVTGVEMKVKDIDRAREIKQLVDEKLSTGVYHTMDWEELNHGLFTALRIQQILMSLVLALIVVVAAFTVIATLIMVVLDKKREIAVLKAMGAKDGALLRAFLYQGGIIGLMGAVSGLILGYGACKLLSVYGLPLDPKVYFISKLPVQMRPETFALVGIFAVIVCLLATVWPALHAARLRPAEAFREQN
jgi:lipoprotein-releasing system permease protein